MAIPTVASVGASDSSVTACAPTPGTHQAADWLLAFVESQSTPSSITAGWTKLIDVAFTAGGSSGIVYYKKATSGAEGAPTITAASDHVTAHIEAFRGCDPTNPFLQVCGTSLANAASTAAVAPGTSSMTITAVNDCLVVNFWACALDSAAAIFSSPVNATLANLTEQFDGGTALGGGGVCAVITGDIATAGIIAPTTGTLTSTGYVGITIVLQPPQTGNRTATTLTTAGQF